MNIYHYIRKYTRGAGWCHPSYVCWFTTPSEYNYVRVIQHSYDIVGAPSCSYIYIHTIYNYIYVYINIYKYDYMNGSI